LNDIDPPAAVRSAASLDELAARIKADFAVAEQGQRQAIAAYRTIGQSLLAAKSQCRHGEWLPWLTANVPFTERHARRYMTLAKSDVTSDLESVWRSILGNDAPEPEPEPNYLVPVIREAAAEALERDGGPVRFDPVPEPDDDIDPNDPTPDRGDAWEPDDEDGEVEVEDAPPPQTDELPRPAFDVSRQTAPSYFKPGGKAIDPDHPFRDLMTKFTALSAAVTKAMAEDTPHAAQLRDYLSYLSKFKFKVRMVLHTGDVINAGEFKAGRARFVGLQALRKIIDKAGTRKKPMTPGEVAKEFAAAFEEAPEVEE